MNQSIKVKRAEVKDIVERSFPEYNGRKFVVEFAERVTFYDTNWSGGTCNKYVALSSDGQVGRFVAPAPWVNVLEGQTVDLPENVIVVCHEHFCGHDMGIRIYANPAHAPKWLHS